MARHRGDIGFVIGVHSIAHQKNRPPRQDFFCRFLTDRKNVFSIDGTYTSPCLRWAMSIKPRYCLEGISTEKKGSPARHSKITYIAVLLLRLMYCFNDNTIPLDRPLRFPRDRQKKKTISREVPLPNVERFGINWRRDRSIHAGRTQASMSLNNEVIPMAVKKEAPKKAAAKPAAAPKKAAPKKAAPKKK